MKKTYYYSMGLLLIAIILALVCYFFLVKTVWQKAAVISSYQNDLTFGDQKKEYAENMLLSFETTQADIDTLQNFFVKKQGEVEFIEYVEQSAKERGLEIKIDSVSLDSTKEMTRKGMEYLVLRFNVSGGWTRVWNFSQALEVLPYSIDVDSLALLRADTDKTKPALWKGVYNIRVLKKK